MTTNLFPVETEHSGKQDSIIRNQNQHVALALEERFIKVELIVPFQ